MNLKLLSVLLAFVLALPLPAVAGKKNDKKDIEKIGERDVGKGMNWYSLEKEIAIGKRLAQQVESQSRIVNDPVVAEYVNRVGQNLEPVPRIQPVPVVIEDPPQRPGLARPAPAAAVLHAAVDVVGRRHIHIDVVKLGQRKVLDEPPPLSPIAGYRQSAVVSRDHEQGILGVNPQILIVAVNRRGGNDAPKGIPCILAHHEPTVQ